MDAAHLHLLINHIPILGLGFGAALLALGMVPKLKHFAPAGLLLLALSGLSAYPALVTGERAEDIVEEYQGASERAMHQHEEAAERFLPVALLTGIMAALALAFWPKHKGHPVATGLTLAVALAAVGLAVPTGNTGGQIRRPELRAGQPTTGAPPGHVHDGEHDDD